MSDCPVCDGMEGYALHTCGQVSEAIGLEIERRDRVDTYDDMLETTEHPRVFYDSLTEAYEVDLGDSCLCEVYGKNRRAKAMMIATLQARNEALEKAAREVVGFYAMNSQHPSEAVDALAALLEAEK